MFIFDGDFNETLILELSVAEIKLIAQLAHMHLAQFEGQNIKAGNSLINSLRHQTNIIDRDSSKHGVWPKYPVNFMGKRKPIQMNKPWYVPVEGVVNESN